MFPGLNSLLDCSETRPLKNQFILISESDNDGSFLLHHFLSLYIKGGFNVCFLALVQSFAHYSSVAQKLGLNLSSACDERQLVYIDGLKLASQALSNTTQTSYNNEELNPFNGLRDTSFNLQPLYNQVKQFAQQSKAPCLVLVDDLSVLISLGVQVQDVYQFTHYCMKIMCYSKPTCDGSLLALVNTGGEADDEDLMLLWRRLCHVAHTEMHVAALSSGYCKDVHGQLTIRSRNPDLLSKQLPCQTVTQYKIQDRMVTFFAPGTSKAVL